MFYNGEPGIESDSDSNHNSYSDYNNEDINNIRK